MMKRTKLYQGLLSLFFLLALMLLISRMSIDVVYLEMRNANKLYISLGVLSLVFASLVKIFRFNLVTRIYHHPIPLFDAALVQMVGISIATLTPGRVGEGSKAVLLNKLMGVPMTSSLGIVIFERFFDMIFLATGAFLFSIAILEGKFSLFIGFFVLILLMFFLIFIRYYNHFERLLPEKYKGYFTEVKIKNNPTLILSIILATTAVWLLEATMPWILVRAMGAQVSYMLVFGIVCISTIAVILSILPAGIGTMDLSYLLLFPLIGINSEMALSLLLIYRFFGIAVPYIMSLLIMNYARLTFSEVKNQIRG
jgi:uncharacterized membrane protein YbhN (UPF0104 family)